jgi:glycosyltransferase involved in cell wall biosynthesis
VSDPVAYLCADPGIPPDKTKGASVHFRSLASAFADVGVSLDVFMARSGTFDAYAPHRGRVVEPVRRRGLAGELALIAHSQAMYAALSDAGPHQAVYERLSLFGLAGLMHARELGAPLLLEVNAPLWREAALFRSLELAATAKGICTDAMHGAKHVLPVSTMLADELIADGVPSSRIEVVGNGTDVSAFANARPARKPPNCEGRPTLLFLGSLKPWHGIGFLLEAFVALRQKRDCALWIVGDGPERELVARAQLAMPNDIAHTPAVAHEDVPSVLHAADVCVAPYTKDAPTYFSPLKVVEVLAAGRPLLASRTACVLATLHGHEPSGLFEPDDVPDFVATAERLLEAGEHAGEIGIDKQLVAQLDWRCKARRLAELMGVSNVAADASGVANG